ncbi:discoidin domain-containing protein [Sphingobacterium sp. HJSM2_6]|uniref:discoidin domain-containing protein n=1 Tax=Sphingobacterium sp. HJSM2_6 TaxID=3366264 RepID=UPI003BDD5261
MRKLHLLRAIACMLILTYSCEKNQIEILPPAPEEEKENAELTNAWRDNPYKLNVIYFVPTDVDTVPNFKKRLSDILLFAQNEFADNMDREGYGRKSFGLDLISDQMINIIYLKGKFAKATYPYEGGSGAVKKEVDAYFTEHPSSKKSEHNLIIIPTYTTEDPNSPGGPPFYGTGTTCYALDYANLDRKNLGIGGTTGWKATVWIGGLLHELGHGMNASHNKMNKSLQSTLGTALMGAGNSTYGISTTSLTSATAATFNTSQVFSTETRTDWYSPVDFELKTLRSSVENNKIVVEGSFTTNKTVNEVVVWHDKTPYGSNNDYDAVQWVAKVGANNTFKLECPLTDFYELSGDYQLRLGFMHVNGTRSTENFLYTFNNNIPNLQEVVLHTFLPTAGWTIVDKDSEENDGKASNVLDNNRNTFWHTEWKSSQPIQPHFFAIDMGAAITAKGVSFRNRDNLNGALKDIKIYTSQNGTTWTIEKEVQLPKSAKSWINVNFDAPVSTRYFKIESTSSWGDFYYSNLADFAVFND